MLAIPMPVVLMVGILLLLIGCIMLAACLSDGVLPLWLAALVFTMGGSLLGWLIFASCQPLEIAQEETFQPVTVELDGRKVQFIDTGGKTVNITEVIGSFAADDRLIRRETLRQVYYGIDFCPQSRYRYSIVPNRTGAVPNQ